MKIQINRQPCGSVLVTSLLIVTLILTALASYLLLVSNENQAVARDQDWNTCVPIMEAGVEEALSQIHYCSASLSSSNWTALSSNNWTLGADGYYHKTRNIGTNGGYYQVTIQPTNPPVIYSEAFIYAPLSNTNYVRREVRVATMSAGKGGGGLTAKGSITFTGGAIFDSYNSSLGPYNPLIHGTNAVALTDTNSAGAINVGGGAIYGMAVTGPGGTVTASGQGAVGSTNWVGTSTGIEPGWSADDANMEFSDVAAPFTSGTYPSGGTLLLTNYTYLLNGLLFPYYYMNGSLKLNAGQTMMVEGNVTLYVTGDFDVMGGATVIIAPGGSLALYVGGNVDIGGNGVVNETQVPSAFALYGLPTCTTVKYTGGTALYAVVDAPEASLTLAGGSDIYGAFTAHDISVGGNGGVHYDDSLGASKGFVVANWFEIAPQ